MSQDLMHRHQHQPQPYLYDAVQLVVPQTHERHHALVMERLGEDLGTLFRRHLTKKIKPTGVQGNLRRRHSVAAMPPVAESVGWDDDTIAWVGCHALKRLEHIHGKGLVHRDIVGDQGRSLENLLTRLNLSAESGCCWNCDVCCWDLS